MADQTGDANSTPPATKTKTAGADEGKAGDPNANAGGGDGKTVLESAGAEGTAGTPKKGEEPNKKPEGAPEKYEDFKVPEGMTLDAEVSKAFQEKAKAMNLTQGQAQELVDMQAALVAKTLKESEATYAQIRSEWKADAEKLIKETPEKDRALVAKARDTFATPEFLKFMEKTGVGDHPEMIRMFIKIGKAIADDTVVGGGQGGGEKSPADILYPEQGKK